MPLASRRKSIGNKVLIVDGFSGSGKTAVSSIANGLARVRQFRIENILEFICGLHHTERMTSDAAEFLIRVIVDLWSHNDQIGRCVNFRPNDISSVLKSPLKSEYLNALFSEDGPSILTRIDNERPILHLMTHQILAVGHPLFSALGDQLVFLESMRHPLFLLEHWLSYIERYGTDSRDFTLCLDHKGQDVPWFALGQEEEYIASSPIGKVILSLDFLTKAKEECIRSLKPKFAEKLLVVPFEHFVRNPEPYLKKWEELLETERTENLEKLLKESNIPRAESSESPDLDVWRQRYGHKSEHLRANDIEALERNWQLAEKQASKEELECLKKLCEHYEKTVENYQL